MLIIGGSTSTTLTVASPLTAGTSTESLENLNDVSLTAPLVAGQFLVYDDTTADAGNYFWRNTSLTITGGNGILVTNSTGYNPFISTDNTFIRTTGNQTIQGNLTVTGDIIYGGTISEVTIVPATVVEPIQVLNVTATTPPTFGYGGTIVNRGAIEPATGLIFDESIKQWVRQDRTGFDTSSATFPDAASMGTVVTTPPAIPPNLASATATYDILWSAWNDGANSGLDADLLDGQQGTYYRNATNLNAGTLPVARLPAFTGDVTSIIGSNVNTLVNTGVVAGTYGTGGVVPVITVDSKGRITAASTTTIASATNTVAGVITTATQAETLNGTVTNKAVTPYSLSTALAGKQPIDPTLTGIAGTPTVANQLIYSTDVDTFATTSFTSYGRTLVGQTDAQNARAALGIPANTVFSSFTPVQQGGGTNQGTNKVYIGWSGSGLLLQVDATDFANTWPISVSKNAATATKLATPRTINGVAFDGTANITVPVSPDTGWVSIPLVNGFTDFPGSGSIPANPMQCRKIGNVVYIRGGARRVAGPPGAGAEVGVLPVGYRPSRNLGVNIMWISGSDYAAQLWRSFIYSDGRLNSGFTYNLNPATPANGDGNCGWECSFVID